MTTIRLFGDNVICSLLLRLKTVEKRGENMYFIFEQNVNIFPFNVVQNNWDAYKLTK